MTTRDEEVEELKKYAANKYVAFCDVLGFSNAVLDRFDQTLTVYADFMVRMRTWPFPETVAVSMYSDSILIVSEHLHSILHALKNLWFATLSQDWVIRGGVAYGRYWEKRENGHLFVLSDALVRAVKLESSVKYPAIAFSPEVTLGDELWVARFEHGIFRAPLLHFEGLTFVNPFNPYWFQSARMRVVQLLAQFPEQEAKYNWLLEVTKAVERDDVLVPPETLDRLIALGVLERPGRVITD